MTPSPVPVERQEVPVMYLTTEDQVDAIRAGWERLESLVPPRGRRFYGAFYAKKNEYRVCVESREGDDPAGLGLESGSLPGGRYIRVRLKGEPPAVYDLIGPTFEQLDRDHTSDPMRPGIEFYRSRDEIDCLLPV